MNPAPFVGSLLLGMASSAFGVFTFSLGNANRQLIPGKVVVPLYALNAGGSSGTNLAALDATFSVTGTSRFGPSQLYVNRYDPETPADPSDDLLDSFNAGGISQFGNSGGNGRGWVRLGGAFDNVVVATSSVIGADTNGGLRSFSVTVASLRPMLASVAANGGRRAQIAMLVVDAGTYWIDVTGKIGGDRDAVYSFSYRGFVDISIDAPLYVGVPPVVLIDLGKPEAQLTQFAVQVFYRYAGYQPNTSFVRVGDLGPLGDNYSESGTGDSRVVTLAGLTEADRGIHTLTYRTGSAFAYTEGTVVIDIFPEPNAAMALVCGIGLIRRRR